MKLATGQNSGAQASTLVVTLVIGAILGVTILAYLSLVEQQNLLSSHSQQWNAAIAVAEAGIEDGMQHLNNNSSNLTADAWAAASNYFWKSNSLAGSGYYARIWNTNIFEPCIVSYGYMTAAALAKAGVAPVFAAYGQNAAIARGVRVRCWRGSLFIKALAAKHVIDLNGNGILTDSFDSGDPAHSAPGGLYDPLTAKDNGDIASNDTIVGSVDVGNAHIYGHVETGPGGSMDISWGSVGSHEFQATHPAGSVEDGWLTHDSNFTFPDNQIPYTSGAYPDGGNVVEAVAQILTNSITTTNAPSSMPWGGVQSNVIATTTTPKYPGDPPPPGMTTNTSYATSSSYPNTAPAGTVKTNITATFTVDNYPGALVGPVLTNSAIVTTTFYPDPAPSVVTTNTSFQRDKPYPAPGTYIGNITTNGTKYCFTQIDSYTYNKYTYTYYTYSYTYPVYTYKIPTYSYTYNLYETNTIYVTNYYDHVLYSGQYYIDTTLSGKTIVLGAAQLVAANGVSLSGNDIIKIAKGGSLTNWIGGSTVTIGGNGVVNETGLAANYVAICADSVKTLNFGGNGEFIGVMVAPQAHADLNGGGREVFDFTGSLMVESVKMNGTFKFHYDEALSRMVNNGRYLVKYWEEIAVNP